MSTANTVKDYVAYGLDASKPATPAVGTAASYYFATDTGKLYCWTGSSWTGVGSAGSADPTATAGPTAINGSASTFMRSDAAPAIQLGSNSQKGIVQVDGTTITASGGVISGAAAVTGANPTATASDTAVNGVATTFMRSDAAPAVQKCSSSVFGLAKVDNTTITASSGVITAALPIGANPTATGSDVAVNGVATTFMRSDAAPAIQKNDSTHFGLCKPDGTTITSASGILTAVSATQLGNFHPGYVTGRAYGCPIGTAGSTQSSTANTLYAVPFFVGSTTTFTKIQINGSTVHTGNCEFGLYQNSGGQPGSKIADYGSVATANSIYGFTGQTITLQAGTWYWLAAGYSASGDTATFLDASSNSGFAAFLLGSADASFGNTIFCSGSWTFSAGNLPSSFPSIVRVRFAPNIMLTP